MSEIYWITRVGFFQGIFFTILIISLISICIGIIICYITSAQSDESDKKSFRNSIRIIKYSLIPFIISFLGAGFVPTTKEALLIYGVGNTIDFVKQNPTAKRLPDKCIKALDQWVESINDTDSIK